MAEYYLDASAYGYPTFPPEVLAETLNSPPFVAVEGVVNIRDIGGYASCFGGPAQRRKVVKKGYYYRSGEPSRITPAGKIALRALGIANAFDFRTDEEVNKWVAPMLDDIEGAEIRVVRVGVNEMTSWDAMRTESVLQAFEKDELGTFLKTYAGIVEGFAPSFEVIIRHLIDNPDQPCLFHCTAGKDRTGVFAALLLLLLGVSESDIAHDYGLTEIGLQPAIPHMSARMRKEKVYADNWQGAANMARARPETMLAVLDEFKKKYGDAEEYISIRTNLTKDDIENLRAKLLVEVD
ncbi:Tyrosine-protein phosphatase [Hypsizygus marmoreus]|uniref:Tyrosine-protein phosphatase n=1 Tax=Hypsizygus marmoreus TaxID=39966 RepID=A0A369JPW5_HYPMA|nr:Tyrosine-protein phosphatase [Hypsizygus marmoreus]